MARSKWKTEQDGITFRSKFEARVAKYLKENKVNFGYEDHAISYTIPESTHRYTPDFTLPNGVVVEAKGRFTPADRKKMSLVKEQNPDRDIRLIFMVDNTLSKASKTKYTDWATKRGFISTVSRQGAIPPEWYEPQATEAKTAKKKKEK